MRTANVVLGALFFFLLGRSVFAHTPSHASYEAGPVEEPCGTMTHALENTAPPTIVPGDVLRTLKEQKPKQKILIPVAFHVILNENGNYDFTYEELQRNIQLLNKAFAKTRFVFELAHIDKTVNPSWHHKTFDHIKAMTSRLALDPEHFVNVYIVGFEVGGFAFVPWAYPEDSKMHGIWLNWVSMPRKAFGGGWNDLEGKVFAHEMGHYLGLLHTFEGGCVNGTEVGDLVADTPAQDDGMNIYVCDENLDTCPDDPGNDPVHNFMNYTPDGCANRFTPGQVTRMEAIWIKHRPNLGMPLPDTLKSIAAVRLADSQGRYLNADSLVTIRGTVTTVLKKKGLAFVQDTTAAIAVEDTNFTAAVTEGNYVTVTGKLVSKSGHARLTAPLSFKILQKHYLVRERDVGAGKITGGTDAEALESQLLRIRQLTLVDKAEWKGNGTDFKVRMTDGQDTIVVFIDGQTEMASWPAPNGDTLDVAGVLMQEDTTSPYFGGFYLMPRTKADFNYRYLVYGKVTDASNGMSILRGWINVNKRSYYTDINGEYRFALLPGVYDIKFSDSNYQNALFRIKVDSASIQLNVKLKPLTNVTPYANGFEKGDPAGQTTGKGSGSLTWKRSAGFTYNGVQILPTAGDSFLVAGGTNGYGPNERTIWNPATNSVLDFRDLRSATLAFKLYVSTHSAGDRFYILFKRGGTDGSSMYVDLNGDGISDASDSYYGSTSGWQTIVADISYLTGPEWGKDVELAFVFESDSAAESGFGVAIDSVVITGMKAAPLAMPAALQAKSYESGQVTLTWQAPSSNRLVTYTFYPIKQSGSGHATPIYRTLQTRVGTFLNYKIYRRDMTLPDAPFEPIGTTNALTYVDKQVKEGTIYAYRVTALYEEGESLPVEDPYAAPGVPVSAKLPLKETFEQVQPGQWPGGWKVIYETVNGWNSGDSAAAFSDKVPVPSHTRFAFINDDPLGQYGRTSGVLLSPWVDLSGVDSVQLQFDAFIQSSGTRQYLAIRNGLMESWIVIDSLENTGGWEHFYYDLSPWLAKKPYAQILFLYRDPGVWGGMWAVDNVEMTKLVAGKLAGTVTSRATNSGIFRALVRIPGLRIESLTNEKGQFTLPTVPSGRYAVHVSAFDHQDTLLSNIDIVPGKTTNLLIDLKKYYQPPQGLTAKGDLKKKIRLSWYPPLPSGQIAYDDGNPEVIANSVLPPPAHELMAVKFYAPWDTFTVNHVAIFATAMTDINNNIMPANFEYIAIVPDSNGVPNLRDKFKTYFTIISPGIDPAKAWHVWSPQVAVRADTNVFWVVLKWDGFSPGPIVFGEVSEPVASHSYVSKDSGATWSVLNDPRFIGVDFPMDLLVRVFVSRKSGGGAGQPIVSLVLPPEADRIPFSREHKKAESSFLQQGAGSSGEPLRERILQRIQHNRWRYQLAGTYTPPDVTGYEIYRRKAGTNDAFKLLTTTPRDSLSYLDSGIDYDVLYEYFVRALYGGEKSDKSRRTVAVSQKLRVPPFHTDFETDGAQFISFGGWEWGAPTYSRMPKSGASGKYVWGTLLDTSYAMNADYQLLSPPFILPKTNEATLVFKTWFDTGNDMYDHGSVWIRGINDEFWTRLDDWMKDEFKGVSKTWITKSYSLSRFEGDTVNIMFKFLSDGNKVLFSGWLIDDFAIRVQMNVGHISGEIVSRADNQPVPNARVLLSGTGYLDSTVSKQDGRFTFTGLSPADYLIRISAVGFKPLSDSVTVMADTTTFALFALEPEQKQQPLAAPSLWTQAFGPDVILQWSLPQQRQPASGKAGTAQDTSAALQGFLLFRGASKDRLARLDSLDKDTLKYRDRQVQGDSTYTYGIQAVYDKGLSEVSVVQHYQPPFLTIDKARRDSDNDGVPDRVGTEVTVEGIVNSPNFSDSTDYYIQAPHTGLRILTPDFHVVLNAGDRVWVRGILEQRQGELYIKPFWFEDVHILEGGQPVPEPDTVTIARIGESLEGALVTLQNVRITDKAQWPAAGADGLVVLKDDSSQIGMEIDADTDLSGWSPGGTVLNVTGIVTQQTGSTPPLDGYRIKPRSKQDIQVVTSITDALAVPRTYVLEQNYPNPFNPSTSIQFGLPQKTRVRLVVYDLLGRPVRVLIDATLPAGMHRVIWDGRNGAGQPVAGGIYMTSMEAGAFHATKKMLLMK